MSNVPITGLPAFVGPATGNELLPAVSGGVTYQVALSQLLQAVPVGYVPVSREINTGTGLQGGGDLSANRTLSLADTAVAAGSYGGANTIATFTVDAQGRLTAAANSAVSFAGYVPDTRTLTAGTGLTGGGDLSADRTFDLADTAVTPTTYGSATNVGTFTVDQQGRITNALDVAIDIPGSGGVPDTRQVIAGTGLSGGGALSSDVTLDLANTTVVAAPYGGAATVGTFTVDAQGRLTAAADVAIAIANTAVSGLGTASTQNTGTSGATLPFLNGTNTWSGGQTFTTSASYGTVVTLEGTSTDAGPIMAAYGNSATPAAFDDLFYIQVSGNSSTAVKRTVGEIFTQYVDPTNTSEDARWGISTIIAGTKATRWWVGAGLYADGTSDPGAGIVNATGYQVSGTDVFARANTWTGTNIFSTTGTAPANVQITSTDSGTAPFAFDLYRDSSSPAAADGLADIRFRGRNTIAGNITYARLRSGISDPTSGSEDGFFEFYTMLAGVETLSATLGPGPSLVMTTAADLGTPLQITGTSAGAGGPRVFLTHDSASPATGDASSIQALFRDTAGNLDALGTIQAYLGDPTSGSEDFQWRFGGYIAGADSALVRMGPGLQVGGPTGGMPAAQGEVNASAYYDDGVQILPITPLTMTAASGQSEIDFTGIPSTARRVTVTFSGLSLSGTDNMLIQLGDAGGPENTGYVSVSADIDASETTVSSTAGIIIKCDNAADAIHGQVIFTLMDAATFLWTCSGILSSSNGTSSITTSGSKALSAVLTQVRIDTTGTNTFDAGSVNVVYE